MAVALSQQSLQNQFTQSSEAMKDNVAASFSSANVLLHELQLGEQLNESVVETRRADFSLMLAMLAEDVREQSQFILPKSSEPAVPDVSNAALRKEFKLPKQAPLGLSSCDEVNLFNQAQAVIDNDMATIHLTNAMMPKPLAFRDDKTHIASDILENTSIICQLRHKQEQGRAAQRLAKQTANNNSNVQASTVGDNTLNKALSFNAKAWLDSVQHSLVSAPLIN